MNTKEITDYLNNDFSEAALYLNYRATPSLIDGCKNSSRKLVYTIKKKNLKDELKVSTLASIAIAESGYLHGDVSLQGAVVTAAQNYTGSNNLPFLKGEGNFGTRHLPAASAARYIFAHPQKYFDKLFKKEDDVNLINQYFEGEEIEPRFYVPTVPLVLVNGCTGIGVGFASKILNRSLDSVITIIKNKLEGIRILKKYYYPSWNGFKGTVEDLGNSKWKINGVARLTSKKKVLIEEVPITYDLLGYIEVLKKLKDKGVIEKYDDMSENDNFLFEVTLSPDEAKKDFSSIFEDLKLSVTITESLTCLDENNAIAEFRSVEEIFNKYYDIKIEYLEKRIQSEITRLTKEASDLKEVHNFIQDVKTDKVNLKEKRKAVEEKLKSLGYTIIEKLLTMPIYSITLEKAEEAKKKWLEKEAELEQMKKETPKSLWLKDLEELERELYERK